jgi:hypothetical protein
MVTILIVILRNVVNALHNKINNILTSRGKHFWLFLSITGTESCGTFDPTIFEMLPPFNTELLIIFVNVSAINLTGNLR